MGNRWTVAALIGAVACGDAGAGITAPDAAPDAFVGGASALFEVPRPGQPPASGFYALPYPNDIRIDDDDGRIDLSDHIRPNAIIGEYLDVIAAEQRGFSINAALFVRFDNPIDDASLPATAEASLGGDASVYLVDVDADSPSRGQRVPLRFRFEHFAGESIGADWLSALPYPGFALGEQTTYALVVTRRLRATDGTAVGVPAEFAAIAADTVPDDPALARAQGLYQPLWDHLDEPGGDDRGDVVVASVFTTQDATSILGRVRRVVMDGAPPPKPRSITWLREEENLVWYDGIYDGPNFQEGEVPYMTRGGGFVFDAGGDPIIQRMEALRFSFTVPSGAMPAAGWPVVIYSHGTGGNYHSFKAHAALLADRGLAVVGIDQVLHGPRAPGASPEVSFFNLQNPLAVRYNTLQGALDNFQLVRLIRGFDFTERHPGGRTIRFDGERIYFFGHSQGGLTGPPFLAHEPDVDGAVLSGAGGLIYLSLLLKTEPVDIASIIRAFVRDYPLDEFNNLLALIQGWIDVPDPASYARYLVREPRAGVGAKHVFQTEGFTDRFTPLPSIEALATAIGTHQVGPVIEPIEGLSLRGLDVLSAPVAGNQGGVTSVLLQYAERSGSDGHFVVFDVPAAEAQLAGFLGSLAADGVATVPAVE